MRKTGHDVDATATIRPPSRVTTSDVRTLPVTHPANARTAADMERLNRILRLARSRNDRLAIANLETRIAAEWRKAGWTESELALAFGR